MNFVVGGDLGSTETMFLMSKIAASTSPLFALLGGDISYENAMIPCYCHWDKLLHAWQQWMVTPDGKKILVKTYF